MSITITPATLTVPVVGNVYSQVLSASGGVGPYTWQHADPPLVGERLLGEGSALPDGLSLASDGTLSGMPTTLGAFLFYARAIDALNEVGTARFTGIVSSSSITITGSMALVGRRPVMIATLYTVATLPMPPSTGLRFVTSARVGIPRG